MIPNTTPTPNELFNGEMIKMSDTELRIVLIVTRSTLGWISDKETGMRKREDWLSHSQLIKKTGRSGRAISTAIEGCMKNKWIEVRNKEGKLLKTKEERVGNKMYFRLGHAFLDKLSTSEKSSEVGEKTSEKNQTSEKTSEVAKKSLKKAKTPCNHNTCQNLKDSKKSQTSEKSSIEKSSAYKRNSLTKEELSPIQEIVVFYKKIKNYDSIDNWDDHHFARASKSAKAILEQVGNLEQSFVCMKEVGDYCDKQKLCWTIETVVKKFPEWKLGKLKLESQTKAATPDTFVPFDKRAGYKPITRGMIDEFKKSGPIPF